MASPAQTAFGKLSLVLGGLFLANIVRKRMAMPIDDDPDVGS